ncbi:MAG TPA: methyltransferase domain-containing protein [Tepidisphaeraceae bacterium]|jgi:2-polyprenyl-3-methyl-5-hydroxy-6-metoxy-1,4-benzoquinol methylase|nr:methyltransferase domain-containing protein [Tepidisphaeraceae bacterium]
MVIARKHVAERMDAPDLAPQSHLRALAGLRRINRISFAARSMLGPLRQVAARERWRTVRLLDVASGGADVPIALATAAKRHGLELNLTLFDQSDVALDHARQQAEQAGHRVKVHAGNAVDTLPPGEFDVITSSLFLHHLTEADAVAVLANIRRAAPRVLLISDLRRSLPGLAAAHVGCRVLSRSEIVHYDGPASVRGAWTIDEMRRMATRSGLEGATVRRQFPWRMLLQWEARHD